jgi:hypothetical protein
MGGEKLTVLKERHGGVTIDTPVFELKGTCYFRIPFQTLKSIFVNET